MTDSAFYETCRWLPEAPDDFVAQVAALDASAHGRDWRRISGYALDAGQLGLLARRRKALIKGGASTPKGMEPFRLGLVSNCTSSHLGDAITASALRTGLWCDVADTDYDSANTLAHSSKQDLFGDGAIDATLCALNWRALRMSAALGDSTDAAAAVDGTIGFMTGVANEIATMTAAPVILQTLETDPDALVSGYDLQVKGTIRNSLFDINRGISAYCADSGNALFDVDALAAQIGTSRWSNPAHWHWAKLPFDPAFVPFYAHRLATILGAMRGKSRRVAVFDLDNTLWGGVVGDDGIAGLRLGPGSAAGEAFLSVQRFARSLRERGIVLAICSKNDESTALEAIENHPEMLLKERDFAAYSINWTDKASNIKALSDTLDLGLDNFVFIDDNPAERARVRQMLPEVAVPEVGDDPAYYPRIVSAAGYFDAVSFGAEDRQRAEYYRANFERTQVLDRLGDYDAYLKSLNMEIVFRPFDAIGRKRISQLINKTNQFNLTTRRYSEQDVESFEHDAKSFTMQVRLKDQFGDNGMIAVVVCRESDHDWLIDTWLMSCRVLKRRVEDAMLREVANAAIARGMIGLVGEFIPTARNGLVKDLFAALGFTRSETRADGSELWRLDLTTFQQSELPFTVTRSVAADTPVSASSQQAG
jgi:FkbH-like protein